MSEAMKETRDFNKPKRRKYGTGTYIHRRDGTVEYRISNGKHPDGRRCRLSFYGSSEESAYDAYENWDKNYRDIPIECIKTVKEWTNIWLSVYLHDLKSSSAELYMNYENCLAQHILPTFGNQRIDDVLPINIIHFMRAKEELPCSMRVNLFTALSSIFETAEENRLCTSNPAAKYKMTEDIRCLISD